MKLGGNAFRTILHISFFDVEKFWATTSRPIQTETGQRPIRDRRPDRTGPDRTGFDPRSDGPEEDRFRMR